VQLHIPLPPFAGLLEQVWQGEAVKAGDVFILVKGLALQLH